MIQKADKRLNVLKVFTFFFIHPDLSKQILLNGVLHLVIRFLDLSIQVSILVFYSNIEQNQQLICEQCNNSFVEF